MRCEMTVGVTTAFRSAVNDDEIVARHCPRSHHRSSGTISSAARHLLTSNFVDTTASCRQNKHRVNMLVYITPEENAGDSPEELTILPQLVRSKRRLRYRAGGPDVLHFWNLEQYQRRKSRDRPNLSDARSEDRNLPALHVRCVERNFMYMFLRVSSAHAHRLRL